MVKVGFDDSGREAFLAGNERAFKKSSDKMSKSSGGGKAGFMAAGLGGIAARAAGFLGAAKLVSMGMQEVAEDEDAILTLQKYTLSVEEATEAMEMLDDLRAYGGDKVGAADIFGKVMSGQTRILKQYGIELAENSTREQRFAALQELHAKGVTSMNDKVKTLGGSFWQLGEKVGDAAGKLLGLLKIKELAQFGSNVFTDTGKSVDLANFDWGQQEKGKTAAHFAAKAAAKAARAGAGLKMDLSGDYEEAQKKAIDKVKKANEEKIAIQKKESDLLVKESEYGKEQTETQRKLLDYERQRYEIAQKRRYHLIEDEQAAAELHAINQQQATDMIARGMGPEAMANAQGRAERKAAEAANKAFKKSEDKMGLTGIHRGMGGEIVSGIDPATGERISGEALNKRRAMLAEARKPDANAALSVISEESIVKLTAAIELLLAK